MSRAVTNISKARVMAGQAFRLRAGKRNAAGRVADPIIDVVLNAGSDQDAINAAKNHRFDAAIGTGDYAWLETEDGTVIWSDEC